MKKNALELSDYAFESIKIHVNLAAAFACTSIELETTVDVIVSRSRELEQFKNLLLTEQKMVIDLAKIIVSKLQTQFPELEVN